MFDFDSLQNARELKMKGLLIKFTFIQKLKKKMIFISI